MIDPVNTLVPGYQEFMNPLLDVLRRRGALPIAELDRLVLDSMALPPEVLRVPHDPDRPGKSEVEYRIAWARSYLKKVGLLHNPTRGHWAATDAGRATGNINPAEIVAEVTRSYGEQTAAEPEDEDDPGSHAGERAQRRVWEIPSLRDELDATRAELLAEGKLLQPADRVRALAAFHERFGPEALSALDGEALLERMHGRTTKDSLAYWLEFKEDEHFQNTRFGSIAGGSAFKFDIYQTAQGSVWMGGSGHQPQPMTLEQAVEKARSQRQQFLAGDRVLRGWASRQTVDYPALQREMVEAAPDLAEKSWGHKYFSLLYPELLDPNHGRDYQRFQVIKLLEIPGEGRYENARAFVEAAQHLGMPLLDLSSVLFRRNGGVHGYWRVGTTQDGVSEWERLKNAGFAGVGWAELGDLSSLPDGAEGREKVRELVARHHPAAANVVTRGANELFNFVHGVKQRDLVLAMEGVTVLGVGRITGPYFHKAGDGPFPHRRPVEWLSLEEWRLPITEAIRTTFVRLGKHTRNLVAIERALVDAAPRVVMQPKARTARALAAEPPATPAPLIGFPARIHAALQRKRQVILYGPPGTGKTFWAERTVEELAARSWFRAEAQGLSEKERASLRTQGAVETCSFHPAYGYEDFLEGFRPDAAQGQLHFRLRDGVFKRLCQRAARSPERSFFLVIDEINRGDIPRIFGELLTILEKDKRDRQVTLPLSGEAFSVPENVFLVGTMNTADRSIALLDAALRRRFAFIELLPDSSTLRRVSVGGLPLGPWLDELNRRIIQHVGRDGRSLQVGHSYLLTSSGPVRDVARFAEVLRDDILPLLEEYCYADFEALERILGHALVDRDRRRFDERLFAPERHDELIQTLLAAFADIAVTKEAVEAETAAEAAEESSADEGDEEAAA
jgi:5-methylcytosine-specific restriction protein B